MVIQLCNGHFLSDRSEGRSTTGHGVTKLGFTAEERFLRRIRVIKAALAHLAKVFWQPAALWCQCLCLVCVQLTGAVVGTNVVMDLHDL